MPCVDCFSRLISWNADPRSVARDGRSETAHFIHSGEPTEDVVRAFHPSFGRAFHFLAMPFQWFRVLDNSRAAKVDDLGDQ
jgi:hypothetical protein